MLTTIVDFQCREFTDSLLQRHDIVLLDEKPGTVDFRNGFARPVGEMFAEGNIGEEGFTTRALVRERNGCAKIDDGEKDFANPVVTKETEGNEWEKEFTTQVMKELLKNFNIQILDVEERTGIGDL